MRHHGVIAVLVTIVGATSPSFVSADPSYADTMRRAVEEVGYTVRAEGRSISEGVGNVRQYAAMRANQAGRVVRTGVKNVVERPSTVVRTGRTVVTKTRNAVDDGAYVVGRTVRAAKTKVGNATDRASITWSRTKRALQPSAPRKTGGMILSSVAITAGLDVVDEMRQGGSFEDGCSAALTHITSPVFYVGELLGATVGATLGAAIPLPAFVASGSFFGSVVGRLPVLGGAMLFATLGATAVDLWQRDALTFDALLDAVDVPQLSGQVIGAAVGSALASVLIPVPGLATLVGGVLGGMAGGMVATWLTGGDDDVVAADDLDTAEASKPDVCTDSVNLTDTRAAGATQLERLRSEAEHRYDEFLTTVVEPERRQAFERYVQAKSAFDEAKRAWVAAPVAPTATVFATH